MKKKLLIFMMLLGLLAIGVCATAAAITVRKRTTNVITTGAVKVQLVQKTTDETGAVVAFTPTKLRAMVPGSRYVQMPYAKNVGSEDCYVRIAVQTRSIAQDGETRLPDAMELDINERDWVLDADGWYRYVDVLKAGEETAVPLFTGVSFPFSMDNRYLNANMEVALTVQGVQAEYNEYETSVLEVDGFPDGTLSGDTTQREEVSA